MHVIPLNFFIPPFPPEFAARTLQAHAVAGLVQILNADEDYKDHVWDFPAVLGLAKHVQWWGPARSTLLSLAANDLLGNLISQTGKATWLRAANQLETVFRALPFIETYNIVSKVSHYWFAGYPLGELIMSDSILHPDDAAKIPADVYQRLTMNLEALKTALLNKDPMMPQHLRNSHALLITYPESRHLLSPTAVSTLIGAAQAHMNITIVSKAAAAAVSKSGGGRGKKVSVDDL